jgi:hypothetical protein
MHASVVVNRIPYVMLPSPLSLTSLFRSVTSWRKLLIPGDGRENKEVNFTLKVSFLHCGIEDWNGLPEEILKPFPIDARI